LNIIVLIKEVPDMERVRFNTERGTIDRSSASAEINPLDLYALQAAVDLKNQYGGHITAISMGPESCITSLRDAWARGADTCICVTDKRFGGSDTLATSQILAAAISRIGSYDLILCGEKTVDGDTAQVPAEVAELLDIPHSYYVSRIFDKNSFATPTQIRKMKLPALASVSRQISTPLLPSLKRKLDSLSVNIEKVRLEGLEFASSPTKVSKIVVPKPSNRKSMIFRDDIEAFIEAVKNAR